MIETIKITLYAALIFCGAACNAIESNECYDHPWGIFHTVSSNKNLAMLAANFIVIIMT